MILIYTLLHNFSVVHSISYVDIGFKRDMGDRRIKVENVRWRRRIKRMQIGVDSLYKSRFSCPSHAYRYDCDGLFRG